MYKYLLSSLEGINWIGIAPLLIFSTIFFAVILYTIFGNKNHFDKMADLPNDYKNI
jgi:hypothetical protein